MAAVGFFLIFVAFLVFMDRMSGKFPDEIRALSSRLTNLIPDFDGANADLKCSIFCFFSMGFIILLVLAF